jgi:hypothetical protein
MLVLFQRAFIDGLKDQDKFLGGLILKVRLMMVMMMMMICGGKRTLLVSCS